MLFTYLKAFITVADLGSFNKAAEELNLTTTAIMKRINKLESEVDAKLLVRDNNGVTLTQAGKSFFQDAQYIKRHIEDSIVRAQQIEKSERTLKIGVTQLTPTNYFMDVWPFISQYCPDLNLELVPIDYVLGSNCSTFSSHTDSLDAMLGSFDQCMLDFFNCSGITICSLTLCLCASESNYLSSKEHLTLSDLKGQRVHMLKKQAGIGSTLDNVYRNFIELGADIVEFESYNIDLLKEIDTCNDLLLCFPNIVNIYPQLKKLDLDLNETMSFGLIHTKEMSASLHSFISAFERHQKDLR